MTKPDKVSQYLLAPALWCGAAAAIHWVSPWPVGFWRALALVVTARMTFVGVVRPK